MFDNLLANMLISLFDYIECVLDPGLKCVSVGIFREKEINILRKRCDTNLIFHIEIPGNYFESFPLF